VTGNEDINCATLSLTAGTDFTLTNISTITSITQTSSDVCTIIAVSTATANGDAVVSTLTRASTFSIDDTAGNSQTVLAGSPQSVTVTRNGEPNAPVISSVTAGNTQVTVVWSTPASNGSTITDYLIKYSLSADGTYTTFADGVSTATSATVTGLTNGTAYYFKVAAKNSVGTGSYSAASADATPTMPTLTISYAAGSGSGTAPVSPVSVLSGSTFTTPANTYSRTGYTFAGWSDGSATYAAAATYPSSGTVASNVTLTAQWTANTLTVTTDEQGGTAIDSASTTTGASMSLPGTPTRTGYTFAGWFVATSGGSAITFPYAHGRTADFTLYAQWTAAALSCANGGVCALGDIGPGGGKVFYVSSSNFTSTGSDCGTACKYLEAAPSDHSSTVWWCSNTFSSLGVTGTGIGSGMSNTTTADNTCASGAIQVAADYATTSKRDWHLPSKDELAQLYIQRTIVGFSTLFYYWSSSEYDGFKAWGQEFGSGDVRFNNKDFVSLVRPVRAFG
jgi:titin